MKVISLKDIQKEELGKQAEEEVVYSHNARIKDYPTWDRWHRKYSNEESMIISKQMSYVPLRDFSTFITMRAYINQLSKLTFLRKISVDDDNDFYKGATYDYIVDYDTTKEYSIKKIQRRLSWNMGFYGRGDIGVWKIDKKKNAPIPEVFDPLNYLYDPDATSAQGDESGKNRYRFCGVLRMVSVKDVRDNMKFFGLKSEDDIETFVKSAWRTPDIGSYFTRNSFTYPEGSIQTMMHRQFGTPLQDPTHASGKPTENSPIYYIEWITFNNDISKKVIKCFITGNFDNIFRVEEGYFDYIPHITAHPFDTGNPRDLFSIPKMTIDGQIMTELIQTEAGNNTLTNQTKIHLVDPSLIDAEEFQRLMDQGGGTLQLNKRPSDRRAAENAVVSVSNPQIDSSGQYILDRILNDQLKNVGVTAQQQGQFQTGTRTATEIAEVAAGAKEGILGSNTGLANVMQLLFKYIIEIYAAQTSSTFKKQIHTKSHNGIVSTTYLAIDDIKTTKTPHVEVKTNLDVADERRDKLPPYRNLAQMVYNLPFTDKRLFTKDYMKESGFDDVQIQKYVPPTDEEKLIDVEDIRIERGENVRVHLIDNDILHIEKHAQRLPSLTGKAKKSAIQHIRRHYRSMELKNTNRQAQQIVLQLRQQQTAIQQQRALADQPLPRPGERQRGSAQPGVQQQNFVDTPIDGTQFGNIE